MDKLDSLLALEAIRTLKAQYFRFVDSKNWAALGELFAVDAHFDIRDDVPEGGLLRGRAPIMALITAGLTGLTSVHHGHEHEVELLSATSARGICAMEDKLWWPKESASPLQHLHGYGHYFEDYALIEGRWQIKSLRLKRLRVYARGR